MIWGSQWKVIVVPGILIVATVVTGLASVPKSQNFKFQQSPYIIAAITNLVLVLLTAGRIWWIRRDARYIGVTALNTRYDRAIAMIVESGAIYLISTILLIVTYPLRASESFQVLQAITAQLINVVPMLIIVRVGLGHQTQPEPAFQNRESLSRAGDLAIHSTINLFPVRQPSK
ncbi:hypothetical protein DFH08DRAFT_57016 [Mycena albidolilacea]|uniref:Uncharacterized protein n=1 Tax=Mycena albidolilacea TaxID=1033008 RepID=A0AAD6Z1Z6_9AGAR|nr:hypothetical protein DFH08DRAFT_57016 [Mycena albidolilacea]